MTVRDAGPTVSIVCIFFNEETFIREAVESVISQSYSSWELLLVDDGSTDDSTDIALEYAAAYPGDIQYLEHAGHQNLGMSAARNLGLRHARGEFLAFIDADDMWLGHKLESQVSRMESLPSVEMMYGATQYWYSWTGRTEDKKNDFLWRPVVDEQVFNPPQLLRMHLDEKILMPCIGSILVRRQFVHSIGGWENEFQGLHEDQVFFTKVCLNGTVAVSPLLVDRYRQHPNGCCTAASPSEVQISQMRYLDWVEKYLAAEKRRDSGCWRALERARRRWSA